MYYKLDEPTDTSEFVLDSSGFGYHGEMKSDPNPGQSSTPTVSFPNPYSMEFTGSDYVEITGVDKIVDDFSICFWMKTTSPGDSSSDYWYKYIYILRVVFSSKSIGTGIMVMDLSKDPLTASTRVLNFF
jgi:hypothetical protein